MSKTKFRICFDFNTYHFVRQDRFDKWVKEGSSLLRFADIVTNGKSHSSKSSKAGGSSGITMNFLLTRSYILWRHEATYFVCSVLIHLLPVSIFPIEATWFTFLLSLHRFKARSWCHPSRPAWKRVRKTQVSLFVMNSNLSFYSLIHLNVFFTLVFSGL